MWDTSSIIKRLFQKQYVNITNIHEPLTTNGQYYKEPKLYIGSEFIGGGIMGTTININSSIENNYIKATIMNRQNKVQVTDKVNYVAPRPSNTTGNVLMYKTTVSGNMCFIPFYGVAVQREVPPANNLIVKYNSSDASKYSTINVSTVPVGNRIFKSEYNGCIFIPNAKKGDVVTVEFYYDAIRNNTLAFYFSSLSIFEEGQNLPNKINVFVTE